MESTANSETPYRGTRREIVETEDYTIYHPVTEVAGYQDRLAETITKLRVY